MREFYKKLASIFVRRGKYPYLLVHNSTGTLIPAYSWCWAGKPGEFMADTSPLVQMLERFQEQLELGRFPLVLLVHERRCRYAGRRFPCTKALP